MMNSFEELGYSLVTGLFSEAELEAVRGAVTRFHHAWVKNNTEFYETKAVNAAYLTSNTYMNEVDRETLFNFIGSSSLMALVKEVLGPNACFMNTQLFFDPVKKHQKNYWHRDPQYHLTIDEQKHALAGPKVIHFRVPLVDEPGMELIPGTHKQWDTEEQLNVRLEQNGHKNYEDLKQGVVVNLNAGDVLVFSANMIHRGLYGNNRMALDILFCDPDPQLMEFVDKACLPSREIMKKLDNSAVFEATLSMT